MGARFKGAGQDSAGDPKEQCEKGPWNWMGDRQGLHTPHWQRRGKTGRRSMRLHALERIVVVRLHCVVLFIVMITLQ
jgi:hypothetical protein